MMKILYIDPGTGSMLFTLAVGVLSALWFGVRALWLKFKYITPGAARKEGGKKGIVIYGEDRRYASVFKPVLDEFERRKLPVTYLAGSADDPLLEEDYSYVERKVIGLGNKAYAALNLLSAKVLLSTTPGLDVYQWKRSKGVDWYVHLPHMPGELTTYKMFGTRFYDALLLSCQYQVEDCRALEKVHCSPEKECILVGVPYLDAMAERLRQAPCPSSAVRTVLIAPSWGPNSLLNRFGETLIDALAATGYHIVLRPHPQSFVSEKPLMDRLMAVYPSLEWNRDADNFDILHRADILISDFSGVIFDFAMVFDKPVICAYTDFNKDRLDAWWLDTPIWSATAIPRLGPILSGEDIPHVKEMIDSALEDKSFAAGRAAVREETWMHREEGAALVVDYLTSKIHER